MEMTKNEHWKQVLYYLIDLEGRVLDTSENHLVHIRAKNIVQTLKKWADVLLPTEDYAHGYWDQVRSEECSQLLNQRTEGRQE